MLEKVQADRLTKLQQIRELGIDPYGGRYDSAEPVASIIERYVEGQEGQSGDVAGRLATVGRNFLRREMTQLERFVLLQICDASWKDHLLAMDHLKSGIGLRSYAEQDPRVAFKREGARLFQDMLAGVREKVTDMIFKVRLTADTQMANVYQVTDMVHEQLTAYDEVAKEMAAQQQAQGPIEKTKPIIRGIPKVGRNDPCPCGSGKKFKKCCGRET